MKKTNFDVYLEERLEEPEFARRFEQAGKVWDIALHIAMRGKKARTSRRSVRKHVSHR